MKYENALFCPEWVTGQSNLSSEQQRPKGEKNLFTHYKCNKYWRWLLILLFLLPFGLITLSGCKTTRDSTGEEARSFSTIDCSKYASINGESISGDLLFFRQMHGFLENDHSILNPKVPEIFSSTSTTWSGYRTIIVQQIPTQYIGYKVLEEPETDWVSYICFFGMAIGIYLGYKIRHQIIWDAIVGGSVGLMLAVMVLCFFDIPDPTMYVIVDNASATDISFTIDQFPSQIISGKSHMAFCINEGTKKILIKSMGENDKSESFSLSAEKINCLENPKSSWTSEVPQSEGYIINAFSINKYQVDDEWYAPHNSALP